MTDWILAYNLQANKVTFPTYDALNIIMTPDNELVSLSQKLLLPEVDKERIIRILGYLGFSNNVFDQLPVETFEQIVLDLDCKSILTICKVSAKFAKFCEKNLDRLLSQSLRRVDKFDTRQQLVDRCQQSTIHLVKLYNMAVEQGKVVDVSKLQLNGYGGKLIDYPYEGIYAATQGKGRITGVPIVSDNYASYDIAMAILGPGYRKYAIIFLTTYGNAPIVEDPLNKLKRLYAKAVESGGNRVLDVSNIKVSGGNVKLIPKHILDPRKKQVDDIPIVSDNYAAYDWAVNLLSDDLGYDYQDYADAYLQMYRNRDI